MYIFVMCIKGGREREREGGGEGGRGQEKEDALLSSVTEASKGRLYYHLAWPTLCALCDLVMTNIPLCLHIQS